LVAEDSLYDFIAYGQDNSTGQVEALLRGGKGQDTADLAVLAGQAASVHGVETTNVFATLDELGSKLPDFPSGI
jgi:hypothetical protein